ncbi:MAG: class I SAM-dependent methyltransferase, partial [Bdellovibrionota bacterium]
ERSFRGPTIFSKMMHLHPIEQAAAQAVRNRRAFIARVMNETRAQHPANSRLRVLSVACGPAREMCDVLQSPEDAQGYDITLLDQDPHAIAEAKEEVQEAEKRIGTAARIRFVLQSVRTMLQSSPLRQEGQRFDLIYSMGLFDYLTEPVARAVLNELFELLAPGGQLIVGNFHPRNKTRIYMEYWADWTLIYRDENELRGLVDGFANITCEIENEPSGCQCFLRIRRTT